MFETCVRRYLHARMLGCIWIAPVLVAAATAPGAEPTGRLAFDLPDTFGRQIRAGDYAGQVVLVTCGSAWCGGCQQDACVLPEVIGRYADKGVRIIHTMAGDSELNSLEFQRHYRLGIVHLLDADRIFEKQYNRNGWPFTMLFGADGQLLYAKNDALDRMAGDLAPRIEEALAKANSKAQPTVRDSVPYLPGTLKRSGEEQAGRVYDRYASVASGKDGRLYAAFTSNRNGNSDVFLRVFNGKTWSADMPIAATAADEFDGAVLVDRAGKVWLTWTSNAGGERYNIVAAMLDDAGKPTAPQQVSDSEDDAMHARMTCDATGHLWITYYKWAKMGEYSRDREVFVRRHDGKAWSREVHVSPEDVPEYEDHCEPVLLAGNSGVTVGWSWDFHQPKGYPHELQDPTVFARTVGADLQCGPIIAIGDEHIDEAPAIAAGAAGQAWYAWTASVWQNALRANRKILLVRPAEARGATPTAKASQIGTVCANLCTPCLVSGPNGKLTLLWSEQAAVNGPWVLKRSECQAGRWSSPQVVETKGNPRFVSGVYDSRGQLWTAFTQDEPQGRGVICRPVSVTGAQSQPAGNQQALRPVQ